MNNKKEPIHEILKPSDREKFIEIADDLSEFFKDVNEKFFIK